jgi:hypothetical protein
MTASDNSPIAAPGLDSKSGAWPGFAFADEAIAGLAEELKGCFGRSQEPGQEAANG